MEDALHQLLWALKDLIVPALAVALTGLLKTFMPKLKDAVPSVAWPFVALFFARMGTKFCYAIDAPCEGNFVNWSDPEAYAIAQGILVVVVREVAKDLKNATPKVLERLGADKSPPAAPLLKHLDHLVVVLFCLSLVACGPVPHPNVPVFRVGDYAFQRADCEDSASYLEHNGQALTLFEQLGGSILTMFVQRGDGPLLAGDAGFDYLGLAFNVLQAQIGAGIRPSEIPNVFLLRPFTCHEFVRMPPTGVTASGMVPPS